jgi:hypothetical protein
MLRSLVRFQLAPLVGSSEFWRGAAPSEVTEFGRRRFKLEKRSGAESPTVARRRVHATTDGEHGLSLETREVESDTDKGGVHHRAVHPSSR